MRITFTFTLLLLLSSANSQIINHKTEKSLQKHLFYLSSDSLEGRRAGTNGENLAAQYIATKFKNAKLSHYNDQMDFFQFFEIFDGYTLNSHARLTLNQIIFYPNADFFILPFSSMNAQLKGEVSPSLNEKNNLWIIDIADYITDKYLSPHTDIYSGLRTLSMNAQSRGATGLIFFSSDTSYQLLKPTDKFKESLDIPVVYITDYQKIYRSILTNESIHFDLSFELIKKLRKSKNVVGYIDNKKAHTVIIGAHYDHLGYGEDGNIMNKAAMGQIHNGADDNASGTSALIELSSILKQKKYRDYNYILIAFSAEELGLLGSKYFVENHDFTKLPIKFMINMDMIGRLSDSTKSITIGGYGTSPEWHPILTSYNKKNLLYKFDSSGTGPSDHTSFYRKSIPVLFYFTGLHSDYHKPTDDATLINYKGISTIIKHITYVTKTSNTYSLPFQKTREIQTSTNTRFSVSLGIMPDYSFSGSGVRVDGVSEGKLAQKIGLQAGDILVRLGSNKISSVESYMKGLASYKKGDTTDLEYLRNGKSTTIQITFQ